MDGSSLHLLQLSNDTTELSFVNIYLRLGSILKRAYNNNWLPSRTTGSACWCACNVDR